MPGVVTVACKMPNGLLLRVFKMVEGSELVLGGGTRTVSKAEQVGSAVEVKGVAVPFGARSSVQVVGGYALTPGVDADFFAEWMKQNADHDAVKNRLIFTHEKADFVEKRAKESAAVTSGLEPLDPTRVIKDGKMVPVDPRIPSRIEKGEKAA